MANIQYSYGHHQPYGHPQQQGYAPAQPTQLTVSNAPPQTRQAQDGYGSASSRSCATGLGVTIVIIGILCVIFQIVASALFFEKDRSLSDIDGYVWTGFWVGAWFIVTGAIGIASGSNNSKGWIISFMVLNIISCTVFVWVLLGTSSASVGILNSCSYYYYYSWTSRYFRCSSQGSAAIGMNSLMIISALTLFVICLIASIIGCCSTCCSGSRGQVVHHGTIVTGGPGYAAHYDAGAGVQILHVNQYPHTQQQFVQPQPQPMEQLPSYAQVAINQPQSGSRDHQTPAPQYMQKSY